VLCDAEMLRQLLSRAGFPAQGSLLGSNLQSSTSIWSMFRDTEAVVKPRAFWCSQGSLLGSNLQPGTGVWSMVL